MNDNVINFFENLIMNVNQLGIHLFAMHYSHVVTAEVKQTVIPFDNLEQLQSQANISCLREAAKSLLELEYIDKTDIIHPIQNVEVDFQNAQTFILTSDVDVLKRMNIRLDILDNLMRLCGLSSLDQYVYLNLALRGNDPSKWDIQKMKQCYGCMVDDETFITYFLDLSISLVKKTLSEHR